MERIDPKVPASISNARPHAALTLSRSKALRIMPGRLSSSFQDAAAEGENGRGAGNIGDSDETAPLRPGFG